MFEQEHLLKIANLPMPFGKYKGRPLLDLPEAYLLWMQHKGWPKGELGELLMLTLEIKVSGSAKLLQPLRGKWQKA